jgi:RNA polymerase sigma-70 factor (ECF subfamily)
MKRDNVARAQQGDSEAFIALFEQEKESLWRVAKAVLQRDADAADALQETALKAWKSVSTFQGKSSFNTWLTRILLNTCYDILKKRKQETFFSPQTADCGGEKDSASRVLEALAAQNFTAQAAGQSVLSQHSFNTQTFNGATTSRQSETQMDVQATLARLGEDDRLVLTLFYLNDYSIKQIASLLSVREGTIRVRLSRARERFRSIYLNRSADETDDEQGDASSYSGVTVPLSAY